MKNNIFYITILFILFTGCSDDLLNKSPLDKLSPDSYFRNELEVELAVNGIYNRLDWQRFAEKDQFTDDLLRATSAEPANFLNGTLTAYASSFSNQIWTQHYIAIGRANMVLSKIDGAAVSNESVRNRYKGEALFLRSLFYFELAYLFGDVPIILGEPTTSQDEIFVPRTPLAVVFDQIEKDLLDAIAFLPSRKATGFVNGRASKGAAQTLLAKVYLFQNKWDQVVSITNDIINSQDYSLFPGYGELFLEPNEYNQEVIFDITYIKDLYSNNIPQRYGAHFSPTLSLAEAYGYADGRPFNPDTDYQSGQPFINRDLRLYENIWLPGHPARGTGTISIPATANESPRRRTSLAIQKFIDFSDQVIDNVGTNFIVFRYADVLLMFAEAKNEVSGPGADVYHAVNQVRNRAGLPGLPGDLSKEDMRERIRHERRLEMAIEGWRFFDIKRWDIGDQTLNLHIMGYDRTKLITPDDSTQWTFNRIIVEDRLWSTTAKHSYGYLFPIPGTELDLNPNLSQNPGY